MENNIANYSGWDMVSGFTDVGTTRHYEIITEVNVHFSGDTLPTIMFVILISPFDFSSFLGGFMHGHSCSG